MAGAFVWHILFLVCYSQSSCILVGQHRGALLAHARPTMPLVVVRWASRVYGICTLSKPCTWKPLVQLTCAMIQLANVSQTVGGPLATANTLVVLATMHPRVYGKIWGGTLFICHCGTVGFLWCVWRFFASVLLFLTFKNLSSPSSHTCLSLATTYDTNGCQPWWQVR